MSIKRIIRFTFKGVKKKITNLKKFILKKSEITRTLSVLMNLVQNGPDKLKFNFS